MTAIDDDISEIDQGIKWNSFGSTNPGRRRELNEDALLVNPEDGIWVVADGMGGHARGDLASSSVVEHLRKIASSEQLDDTVHEVRESLGALNSDLREIARNQKINMIGSTVVVLVARPDGRYACLWAGDSRLYLFRQGGLIQISRDHSEVQKLIDRGAIDKVFAENHPSANVINRAIGAEKHLELDVLFGKLLPGDKCLLCSDGLYREVMEQEIAQLMERHGNPEGLINELMQLALSRGARDNITVVGVMVEADNAD